MPEVVVVERPGAPERVVGRDDGAGGLGRPVPIPVLLELPLAVGVHGLGPEVVEHVAQAPLLAVGVEAVEGREEALVLVRREHPGRLAAAGVLVGPGADDLGLPPARVRDEQVLVLEQRHDVEGAEVALVPLPPVALAGEPAPGRHGDRGQGPGRGGDQRLLGHEVERVAGGAQDDVDRLVARPPLRPVPDSRPEGPLVVPPEEPGEVAVAAPDRVLLGEDLGLRRQAVPGPATHEPASERLDLSGRDRAVEEDDQVQPALAVAVDQQRAEAQADQHAEHDQGERQVLPGEILGVAVVQVDVDQQPAGRGRPATWCRGRSDARPPSR